MNIIDTKEYPTDEQIEDAVQTTFDEMRRYVRKQFDACITSTYANCWIGAAIRMGLFGLAAEMRADLETEIKK